MASFLEDFIVQLCSGLQCFAHWGQLTAPTNTGTGTSIGIGVGDATNVGTGNAVGIGIGTPTGVCTAAWKVNVVQ